MSVKFILINLILIFSVVSVSANSGLQPPRETESNRLLALSIFEKISSVNDSLESFLASYKKIKDQCSEQTETFTWACAKGVTTGSCTETTSNEYKEKLLSCFSKFYEFSLGSPDLSNKVYKLKLDLDESRLAYLSKTTIASQNYLATVVETQSRLYKQASELSEQFYAQYTKVINFEFQSITQQGRDSGFKDYACRPTVSFESTDRLAHTLVARKFNNTKGGLAFAKMLAGYSRLDLWHDGLCQDKSWDRFSDTYNFFIDQSPKLKPYLTETKRDLLYPTYWQLLNGGDL